MSKKKIAIIGVAAVVVLAAVITTVLLLGNKEDAYRVIKVLELDGTATVERENIGELDAYEGMTLQSGDRVIVDASSMVVLQMDDDKYAYAEQNTIFKMIAEGTARDSKTKIELEQGVLTCQVENKLNDSSSYEVHTQNSVMAVRGTVIQVAYWHNGCMPLPGVLSEDEIALISQGQGLSRLMVLEGTAAIFLRQSDGTLEEERSLGAGQMQKVAGNASFGEEGDVNSRYLGEAEPISSENFSVQGWHAMEDISGRTEDLLYSKEEVKTQINALNSEGYEVYFIYGDIVFGVQEVKAGACAVQPGLQPTADGKWNLDFAQPIEKVTYVYWRAE